MQDVQSFLKALWRDQQGQDLLEYVLLGAFAASCGMMCFPAIASSATRLTSVMQGLLVAINRLAP